MNENFAEKIILENAFEKEKIKETVSWEKLSKHLDEYEDFYKGSYVVQTRKQELGFKKPEQFLVRRNIEILREKLKQKKGENFKISEYNQMNHILGNSIMVLSGAIARKFEEGREVKPQMVEKIKEDMTLLNDYVEILVENPEVVKDELESKVGYLGNFLDYFSCDLPTESPKIIKLVKFFNKLEKGMAKKEIAMQVEEINQEQKNIINIEKIKEKLFLVDNKGEEYYKLV
ncbi:MAG: hypothetical protein M0P97_03345 [Candidatus Moranbacteria bacterium]|jgi:hypothetical protein|nr:hypothetical protein [Candidatus Moranbacteria bacterium]